MNQGPEWSSPGGSTRTVRSGWATALVAAAWLLSACGGSDGPAPSSPPPAPPSEVTATIGAAGGTLDGPDGSRVVIPPGALAADTVIGIARRDAGAPTVLPDGYTKRGTYEFTPHDLVFAQPVTMRVPYAPAAGVAEHGLYRASPSEPWQPIPVTPAGGFAEWQSATFSWYGPMECAFTGPVADPYPCGTTSGATQVTPTPATALTLVSNTSDGQWRYFRVREATSLLLVTTFNAPPDCADPRVDLKRRRPSEARAVVISSVPGMLIGTPGGRMRATATHTVQLTNADNGNTILIAAASCLRAYQSPSRAGLPAEDRRIRGFDALVFDAQIPEPPAPVAPQITLQPSSVSVTVPAAATFTSSASGTPAPGAQWESSNDAGVSWTVIAGATASSYTTGATSLADNGRQFRARFTNAAGSVLTNPATLTVTAAPPPPSSGRLDKVAAAFRHTCAIRSSGSAACWGYNSSGQVGSGNLDSFTSPFTWTLPAPVSAVAAGERGSCALTDTGRVFCAGGAAPGTTNVPTEINLAALGPFRQGPIRQVVVGGTHACVLAQDRTVWCWGNNSAGQLGNGSTVGSAVPVQVFGDSALVNVAALQAGDNFTCALMVVGRVVCWGQNPGLGAGLFRTTAIEVERLSGVTQLAAGQAHACALRSDGSVACWGDNSQGQFGNGVTAAPSPIPTATTIDGVAGLASGTRHMCALVTAGNVRCWGTGLMGNGGPSETRLTPVLVGGLSMVVALAAGLEHSCALRANGTLACWGAGGEGQLGQGDRFLRTTPTDVPASTWSTP